MIDIRLNNQSLDLHPDTRIEMEIQTPLFDVDALPAVYSLPLVIPTTNRNRKLLNHPDIISNATGWNVFVVDIYLDGLHWMKGNLRLKSLTDLLYRGNIQAGGSQLAANLNSKKLTDLTLGGPRTYPDYGVSALALQAHVEDTTVKDITETDYNFYPVFNDSSFSDILQYTLSDRTIINGCRAASGFIVVPNSVFIVPFLYASYVLKQAMIEEGWACGGEFLEDNEIKTLTIFNNTPISKIENNGWNIDHVDYDFAPDPEFIHLSDHLPIDVTVGNYIETLKKTFCAGFYFDLRSQNLEIIPIKSIIKSKEFIDVTDKAEPHSTVHPNDYKGFTFSHTDDSSDPLFAEYSNEFDSLRLVNPLNTYTDLLLVTPPEDSYSYVRDNSLYYISQKYSLTPFNLRWVRYQYSERNNAISDVTRVARGADVANMATLVAIGSDPAGTVRYVTSLNQYWMYIVSSSYFYWEYYADGLHKYVVDGGEQVIQPESSTLASIRLYDNFQVSTDGDSFPFYTLFPRTKQKLYLPSYQDAEKSPLRFLFYRGWRENSLGYSYPLGSSIVYDYAGTKIANYGLHWEGEYGLYDVWWKDLVQLLKNTKPVTYNLPGFGAADIVNFVPKTKMLIDGIKYLPTRMKVIATMTAIESVTVDLYST